MPPDYTKNHIGMSHSPRDVSLLVTKEVRLPNRVVQVTHPQSQVVSPNTIVEHLQVVLFVRQMMSCRKGCCTALQKKLVFINTFSARDFKQSMPINAPHKNILLLLDGSVHCERRLQHSSDRVWSSYIWSYLSAC